MAKEKKEFYLVDFEVLPEALKKTIRAKELLRSGKALTINAAVRHMGISRSAYYKYKDHVAAVSDDIVADAVTLFLVMQNDSSVQNKLFRRLAKEEVEILTMNKGIAIKKQATMTLTLRLSELQISLEELLGDIREIKGVKSVIVAGED